MIIDDDTNPNHELLNVHFEPYVKPFRYSDGDALCIRCRQTCGNLFIRCDRLGSHHLPSILGVVAVLPCVALTYTDVTLL